MPIGLQYLRIVLSRWRLVSALIVACTLGAWAFSTFVLANDPEFEASARLNIVPTSEELGYANRFVRGSTFDSGGVLLQTYAEFAHTRPVAGPIVDRWIEAQAKRAGQTREAWMATVHQPPGFGPKQLYSLINYGAVPAAPLREDIVDALIKGTTIETVDGTYLLRITVAWDDPNDAAWFANALADAIIARAERMSNRSGSAIAGSLGNRLDAKRAELAALVARSRRLKQSIGVVDLDRQKQALLEAQITEQSLLATERATLTANQGQVAGLRRESSGKLSSAQAVLEQTLAVEGPRGAGLRDAVAVRERRVAQLQAQIDSLGRSEDAIRTIDDRATALQAEIASLTERTSFSEIENLANAPRIQLVERATAPLVRSSPKIVLNTALGFVAGCALAGCALLVLGPASAARDEELVEEPAGSEPAEAPVESNVHRMRPPPLVPPPSVTWRIPRRPRGGSAPALAPYAEPDLRSMPDLEPEPALVAPRPGDPRAYPTRLPRPAVGHVYAMDECATLAPPLAAWLADRLAPDGRPLVVAGDGDDGDAQALCQLIHHALRTQGTPMRVRDATDPKRAARRPAASGEAIKPLVYAGGLRRAGLGSIVVNATPDSDIVVAVAVHPGDNPAARMRQCAREIALLTGRPPYVVAIGG